MYSLGLVLLELYQPFKTEMERIHTLTDARKGDIPPEFCAKWPVMVSTIYVCLCRTRYPIVDSFYQYATHGCTAMNFVYFQGGDCKGLNQL